MQPKLTLVPPKEGRTPYWYIRGTVPDYGYIEESTRCTRKGEAKAKLKERELQIRASIKAGRNKGDALGPDFAGAAADYIDNDGEARFMQPLIDHFGKTRLADIDEDAIFEAARTLYPDASNATRNRQVFTPVLAVLRSKRIAIVIDRPKGANGKVRRHFLKPEHADAYLSAAWRLHPRFAALVETLLYTGLRLSEALRLQVEDLDLNEAYADIAQTKNGEPQRAHLPSNVVRAIRLALLPGNATWDRPEKPRDTGPVFCLTKSSNLYKLFRSVEAESGVVLPKGVAFHLARHTFGAWTRAAGGQLIETGRWKSQAGAKPYDHYEITDAAKVADRFPGADGALRIRGIG